MTDQHVMSPRCTRIVTLETDHSPFTSMVSETADVIAGVVSSVGAVR